MLYNLFNKVYYMFSKKPENNSSTKPNLEYSSYGISDKTDKESRINILVEIKNIKNTYYKYTYDKKYSEKLYNAILQETEYENGVLISNNSNIYDNEVIKYINYREELSKNTKNNYNLKKNFQTFYKSESTNFSNILYVIDLNERELFEYCHDIIKRNDKINIKDLVFSVIINKSKKIDKYQIIKDYEKLKIVL